MADEKKPGGTGTAASQKAAEAAANKGAAAASRRMSATKDAMKGLYEEVQDFTGGATEAEKALYGLLGGAGDLATGLKEAEGAGGKMNVMFATLLNGASGFMKVLNPVVSSVEKYRTGLVQIGVKDGPKFLDQLSKQSAELSRYGVRLSVLVQAQNEFRQNLAQLGDKTFPGNAAALNKLVAINERFGITTADSVSLINQLDIGFNVGGAQAKKFSDTLLKFAKDTGQPFNKIFGQFNQSIEKFMFNMDADQAMKKFTVFQQIARRMGADVGELVDLTEKFDELEGGMAFGGELNMLLASLGGSFDAVQATLMSQPERMQYIAEQIREVGGKIEGMSELGQRAVLKQLQQTTGMKIGVLKSLIEKDITGDVEGFLSGAQNLSTMQASEQQRLAQEQTTRAERVEVANDRLVNSITIGLEGVAQRISFAKTEAISKATMVGIQALQDAGITKVLSGATAELDKFNAGFKSNVIEGPGGLKDLMDRQSRQAEGLATSMNSLTTAVTEKGLKLTVVTKGGGGGTASTTTAVKALNSPTGTPKQGGPTLFGQAIPG